MAVLGGVGRAMLALLVLVAALVMTAGAVVAGFVGSDDTVFNPPTALGDDGRPVLTAPDLLAYEHVTVTLRASAPEGVFIGTAHPVDVADFVGDSSLVRLTEVTRTGVASEEIDGDRVVEPAAADFWTSSMTGPGVEELTLDRDTSSAQWVIAPLDEVGPTTVSFGITVPGIFRAALGTFAVAAIVLLVCIELLLRNRRRRRRAVAETSGRRRAAKSNDGSPAPTPPGGRRKATRTALALALVLGLSSCTPEDLLPATRQPAELASTKVALTRAEVPALLTSYADRLAAAVKAAQPPRYRTRAWRRADRGPALESDLFATRVAQLTNLGRQQVPTFTGSEAFSARFDSYPMWSLVASTQGSATRVDAFTKASVSAAWKREAGAIVTGDLPEPGRPSRVPEGRAAQGADEATTAWRAYLRSGRARDGLDLDRASRSWRDNIADLGSRRMFTGYTVQVRPAGVSRVLSVADGQLALVALRVTTHLNGRRDLSVRWNPPYGKYRPSRQGVLSFADIAVGVIHIPEKGTPTVLGSSFYEVPVTG